MKISTKETYSITPAENPRAMERNFVLVRLENGKQVSYSLRLDDLVKDGDISANMAMMPGDILIISESWF